MTIGEMKGMLADARTAFRISLQCPFSKYERLPSRQFVATATKRCLESSNRAKSNGSKMPRSSTKKPMSSKLWLFTIAFAPT